MCCPDYHLPEIRLPGPDHLSKQVDTVSEYRIFHDNLPQNLAYSDNHGHKIVAVTQKKPLPPFTKLLIVSDIKTGPWEGKVILQHCKRGAGGYTEGILIAFFQILQGFLHDI